MASYWLKNTWHLFYCTWFGIAAIGQFFFVHLRLVVIVGCNGESNQEQSCQSSCACNWCHVSSPKVCTYISIFTNYALVPRSSLPPTGEMASQVCLFLVFASRDLVQLHCYFYGNCITSFVVLIISFCWSDCTSEFGAKVVPPKRILKMLPELFDHQDQNVRASSKGLTLELCRWIGKDPVKSILFEKMRDTMVLYVVCLFLWIYSCLQFFRCVAVIFFSLIFTVGLSMFLLFLGN